VCQAAFSFPAGRCGALGGRHWFPILAVLAASNGVAGFTMRLAMREEAMQDKEKQN